MSSTNVPLRHARERHQALRRARGAARDRPRRRSPPGGLPDRRVGLRQVDAAPLHQPARARRRWDDRRRRSGADRAEGGRQRAAAEDRHRLSGVQPVPAHDRARERDPRADARPQAVQAGRARKRTGAARDDRARGQGDRVPRPPLGRAAATRRDRAGAGDEPDPHAARRDHERARPAARRRGARVRPRARGRGDDDDRRHPRDGLRARARGQGLLPRRRRDPRGGTALADLRPHRGRSGPESSWRACSRWIGLEARTNPPSTEGAALRCRAFLRRRCSLLR